MKSSNSRPDQGEAFDAESLVAAAEFHDSVADFPLLTIPNLVNVLQFVPDGIHPKSSAVPPHDEPL